MIDLVNSWRSKGKQGDKFALKVRIGKLTLFDFYYDHSKRMFGIILFNLGLRNVPKKQEQMGG